MSERNVHVSSGLGQSFLKGDTLYLRLPDWETEDTIIQNPEPFALWQVGGMPLLYHWFDFALNSGFRKVSILSYDRPERVRAAVDAASLWRSLELEIHSSDSEVRECEVVDRLPGMPILKSPMKDGWDIANHWASLDAEWLFSRLKNRVSIGRCVRIHPTARIEGPVWIGDGVSIGHDCYVGPGSVLESESFLAGNNAISHSRVKGGTAIGLGVALHHGYLTGEDLVSFKSRKKMIDLDPALAHRERAIIRPRLSERWDAYQLWRHWKSRVDEPTELCTIKNFDGRTFLLGNEGSLLERRLPLLKDVFKGRLHLFGLLPRTADQMQKLPLNWREVIKKAPVGAFSFADTLGCHSTDLKDESMHAVYQATQPTAELMGEFKKFLKGFE